MISKNFSSVKKSPLLVLLNSKRLEISPKNGWRARVVGEPMTSFPNWREILNDVRTYFQGTKIWEIFPDFSDMSAYIA